MFTNESGRSMIEMLGVLAIIGVMTVGGLNVIGRSRQMHELGQLTAEVSKVAMTAKKMACDYDSAYGSYTMFLYKSEAYSDELDYENGKFIGPMDSEITINGDLSTFEVSVAGLNSDACIQLAGNDWGKKGTNGFMGVCVGAGECSPSSDEQMELSAASSSCSDDSTVKLKFKACTNE
ncbi:MAG: hypothetical protein IJ532_03005 [Alphaproteobacteria bacterium]|nr:hypothetical protein [Alphaproteobacteria bacterium]